MCCLSVDCTNCIPSSAAPEKTRTKHTEALRSSFVQNREELGSLSCRYLIFCSSLPRTATRDTCACTLLLRGVPGEGAMLRAEKARCETCRRQKMTPAQLPPLLNSFSSCLTCQICFLAPLKLRERKKPTEDSLLLQ